MIGALNAKEDARKIGFDEGAKLPSWKNALEERGITVHTDLLRKEAVEVLDREVGRVLECAIESGYSVILTADHGNCDEMIDLETGEPHTQHSLHPVPCLVIDEQTTQLADGDNLSAIAPTVLQLMGIAKPDAMSGRSLIRDEWAL